MKIMNVQVFYFIYMLICISMLPSASLAGSNWPMAGFDPNNSYWNREEQVLYPPLKKAWQYRPEGTKAAFESVVVASGSAFIASMADGKKNVVFAIDADTGRHKWRFTLPGGGRGSMGVVPAVYPDPNNPLICFGGQGDNNLYALDARTGTEKWRVSGVKGMYGNDPKISGGTLYVNAVQSSLMGVNLRNGRKLWEIPEEGRQSDIVVEDGVLVQGGVYGPPLIGVMTLTGDRLWETAKGRAQSYMAAWSGLVFVAYTGETMGKERHFDSIAAFRVRDGGKEWETRLDDDLHYGCLSVGKNTLYVASRKTKNTSGKGILYALNPGTGKVINQRSDGLFISRMVMANDILYVGGWNTRKLHALNPKTLATVWKTDLEAEPRDMAVANGRLYVSLGWSGLVAYENQAPVEQTPAARGGIFGTQTDTDNTGTVKAYAKKHAIVIGISDYQDLNPIDSEVISGKIVDLKYAKKDAEDIVTFLRDDPKSGGNWEIHALLGPEATENNIKSKIGMVLNDAGADDLVYLFFCGHARRSPLDPSEVYLLPYDFKYQEGYSGIDYDWVKKRILRCGARNIIAFIDACRSGTIGFARGSEPPDQEMLGEIKGLKGFKAIFTSGTGSQVAYEDSKLGNGVFTHFLLKGLRGDAQNTDDDIFVDLGEIEEYVTRSVKDYTDKHLHMNPQTPRIWSHDGLMSNEFPVALRK
jgi:outer membrane protein assembly factor BamB